MKAAALLTLLLIGGALSALPLGPVEQWKSNPQLADRFLRRSVELRDGVLAWTFSPKPKQTFNDIYRAIRSPRNGDIECVVRNREYPASFGIKFIDAAGIEWMSSRVLLREEMQDFTTVRFRWSDFRIPAWSKRRAGQVKLPLKRLYLVVFDLEPDGEYLLEFKEIRQLDEEAK